MSEECTFRVELNSFAVSNLKPSFHNDQVYLVMEWEDKKFKTNKHNIASAGTTWKYTAKFHYKVSSHRMLENRHLKIDCYFKKQAKPVGSTIVDLYTLASGPIEHDLPLLNQHEGEQVGRIQFRAIMEQYSNIHIFFKDVKCVDLMKGTDVPNPYIKYYYSGDYDDEMKPPLRTKRLESTQNPEWFDLQPLWFEASIPEMLSEHVMLEVWHEAHSAKKLLGKCMLPLKLRIMKDDHVATFHGNLSKAGPGEITGSFYFKFLPIFAQMSGIHTEKGILDGKVAYEGFPVPKAFQPKEELVRSQSPPAIPTQLAPEADLTRRKSAPAFIAPIQDLLSFEEEPAPPIARDPFSTSTPSFSQMKAGSTAANQASASMPAVGVPGIDLGRLNPAAYPPALLSPVSATIGQVYHQPQPYVLPQGYQYYPVQPQGNQFFMPIVGTLSPPSTSPITSPGHSPRGAPSPSAPLENQMANLSLQSTSPQPNGAQRTTTPSPVGGATVVPALKPPPGDANHGHRPHFQQPPSPRGSTNTSPTYFQQQQQQIQQQQLQQQLQQQQLYATPMVPVTGAYFGATAVYTTPVAFQPTNPFLQQPQQVPVAQPQNTNPFLTQ